MTEQEEAKYLLLGDTCFNCKYVYTPKLGTAFCFLVTDGGEAVELSHRCDM